MKAINMFASKHNLAFESASYPYQVDSTTTWDVFRIGTCQGLWTSKEKSYQILSVINSAPGNGHFTDVLQWFENSCKRDKKDFIIRELWNKDLKKHLIEKHGFKEHCLDDLIKEFKKMS